MTARLRKEIKKNIEDYCQIVDERIKVIEGVTLPSPNHYRDSKIMIPFFTLIARVNMDENPDKSASIAYEKFQERYNGDLETKGHTEIQEQYDMALCTLRETKKFYLENMRQLKSGTNPMEVYRNFMRRRL